MAPMMSSASRDFDELLDCLAASCHGSRELNKIKTFLGENFKKTAQRQAFLLPRLMQEPIVWDAVKSAIWESVDEQTANQFPFLQGDVIGTTVVLALGIAESSQQHDLWLVLSPDCDCIRAPLVRVAPVFPVYDGNAANHEMTQRFGYSLKLATSKAFPLPSLPSDSLDTDLRGYFADLEEPYYIGAQDKGFATPYASMTVTGWHLLNGLIQEKETRAASIEEATAIRKHNLKQAPQ